MRLRKLKVKCDASSIVYTSNIVDTFNIDDASNIVDTYNIDDTFNFVATSNIVGSISKHCQAQRVFRGRTILWMSTIPSLTLASKPHLWLRRIRSCC